MTINGQMQPAQLTIGSILDYAVRAHGNRPVVSVEPGSADLWR